VIDWDGDGDLDILSGSSEGGVQWAENRAGPGKPPRLESFRTLIEHGPQIEYGSILRDADLKGPLTDTRIWVDDVNGDGKLDILVGDMAPLLSPAAGLSEAEFKGSRHPHSEAGSRHPHSEGFQTPALRRRVPGGSRYRHSPHSEAVIFWVGVDLYIYFDGSKSLPSKGLHA
jgi:hypothetical protein